MPTKTSLPANTTALDALLAPRSVAIIGASSDARRFGGRPIQYLLEAKFPGPVYPINPARNEVQGLKAYPDIAAVPGPVDCAILSVATEETVSAVEACAKKGVKSAVIFSAGFAEVAGEGKARQEKLVAIAREAGMRVLGPNCMGLFNAKAGFYATFASALEEGLPPAGRIGLVSQSGGYGGYVMKHVFRRGLGLSQWITTGNESDVELGELMHWLAGSDDVDVLLAYLEGVRDRERFIAGLDLARRKNKPVVVMKVGRTAEGRVAAASHTAALTGEDAVYDAVFKAYGVYRARTTDELLDVAYALSKKRAPKGRRVGVISISGGIGVQIADFISDAGLELAPVPDDAQAKLKALVPNCSPRNPIDMTGLVTTNHDLMEKTLDIVLASGAFDAVVVFVGIAGAAPSMAEPLRNAIAAAYAKHPERLVIVSVTASEESVRSYDRAGLFVFEDPSRAITALAALARFAELTQSSPAVSVAPSTKVVWRAARGARLSEVDAKALLRDCGIASPREQFVKTAEEAAVAADAIGYPVAVKVVSPNILHKTEHGGVALKLATRDAVRDAVTQMAKTLARTLPDARIDGFLVSEMVSGGVECIIGINRDAVFGPVVTFGLGGTVVELIKDVTCRLAPVSETEADKMIRELRTYPLLAGYRGAREGDTAALARAISALSHFAAAHADILESIEVNPVAVLERGKGLVALDALIQTRP